MSEVDDFFSQIEESKEVSKVDPPTPLPPAKMGRPTTFNEEISVEICELIMSTDMGMVDICTLVGIPYRTFCGWLMTNDDFSQKYARAKEIQQEYNVDRMIKIAQDDVGENMAAANMRKLEIDVIKWQASKLAAKKYGDKKEVDITVTQQKILNDDQFEKLLGTVPLNQQEVIEDIEHEDVTDTEPLQD